ncbi:hypothetical protein MA16_Dca025413 [Dendrobium catenatum]|uniref:Uncharacterized protein n=1 Tax=Dendrobium catenatum TaxID=906689 RepID=A0A2I0WIV3_9ASPA|nr:hypothetical protein MA16_Dca025413 [Dendrobium catenatum]
MYILNVGDVPDVMALSVCQSDVVRASSRPHFRRNAGLYIIFELLRNSPPSQTVQIY